jgi:hypothetical protein
MIQLLGDTEKPISLPNIPMPVILIKYMWKLDLLIHHVKILKSLKNIHKWPPFFGKSQCSVTRKEKLGPVN